MRNKDYFLKHIESVNCWRLFLQNQFNTGLKQKEVNRF